MITLVEFVASLGRARNRDKVLAVLYYYHRYEQVDALTVEQVRGGLQKTRLKGWKKINVADVLAKCGPQVDTSATVGQRRLWKLTKTGEQYVRSILSLPEVEPEIEHDVGTLRTLARQIHNLEIRGYVEEAILCLSVNALRAATVFLWSGAIRRIQEQLLSKSAANLNAALQQHDPKCRRVSTIDHFAYVKDRTTLLTAQDLGLLDKNERETLGEALGLRNRCGHPSKYKLGTKKASSFIEDVVSIIF